MRPLRYQVFCQRCGLPARLKVASRWTDGHTSELKTYALVCHACVEPALAEARTRREACHTDHNESIAPPEIFDLDHRTQH